MTSHEEQLANDAVTPADANPGFDVVLHVRVVAASIGGPDKTILASAVPLAGTRYGVVAAYMHEPGDAGFLAAERRGREHGCPVIGIPERSRFDPRPLWRLLDVCRSLNVRIWHGHDYKSNLFGLLLRPFFPMKLVSTAHGWVHETLRTRLYHAVDRACLRHYDHVIAVSPDIERQILGLGVARERCSLLVNGVDDERFRRRCAASASPLRCGFGVPSGRKVIGAVGRLSAEKGFDVLLRAARTLVQRGHEVELWIAGTGEEEGGLRALCAELGLTDRVRFLGFVDDAVELFQAFDLFVLSSLREGLPNVLLEAMATGVPVVATDVAGVPALVGHGENGLLCRPGDVAGLVDGAERLLADGALSLRLAAAGRRTIEERFRFAARVAAEKELYDRVLGLAPPRDDRTTLDMWMPPA